MRFWNRGPAIGRVAMLVALISPATAVRAHDFWIEPATFLPEIGERVSVSLREGDRFDGRPVPRDATRITQFIAHGPGGAQPIVGLDGRDPAGVARFSAPGMYVLGYRSNHAFTTMEAWRFEEHLVEKGLERIAELRRSRGISNAGAREAYSRYSKSLVRVGSQATETTSRPIGFRFELIAEFNPYDMGSGREASFRLLFDGKPLAGALVTATPRDAPDSAMQARTDAAGRAKYTLRDTGAWLVAAVHMIEAPPGLGAEWESFWASLTFELPGNDSILALKKSLLAKLLFERAAAREGLTLRAVSRGTAPDAAVPEWMRAALGRDGFDIGAWRPVALSPRDLRSAQRVVTFDVSLASDGFVDPATEHWDGLPSVSRDYGMGREAIAARVEQLVHELKLSSLTLGKQRVNRQ